MKSKPPIKLSSDLQKIVSKEFKLVTLAIDSNKSLVALADQIRKNQENFKIISESWGVVQSKLPQTSLNFAGLDSMTKSLETIKSASAMNSFSAQLEKNRLALQAMTTNSAIEKLALASAYSSSSFAKSVTDILVSSKPAGWKNSKMSLTLASNLGQYESITCVHVLNARILNRLVTSKSKSARRNILFENRSGIIKNCIEVVEQSKNDLGEYFLVASNSFKKNDYASSQALSANIIDSLVQRFEFSKGINKNATKSDKFLSESQKRDKLTVENFVILHALAGVYGFWKPNRQLPVPKSFNRHVTAHFVSNVQYNSINALEALMLCAALLVAENTKGLYSDQIFPAS